MDSHTVARKSEAEILRWLHRFGYLTAQQVGRLVWSDSNNSDSRLRLAQRVLRRLTAAGCLLQRRAGPCSPAYFALSQAGASRLRADFGVDAESGKDLIRTISPHRIATNDVAIDFIRQGWDAVWTEREIVTGRAPFNALGGKIPDCAALDAEMGVLWIEIENCRRGGRDMQKLAQWLAHWAFPETGGAAALDPPADKFWLFRVRFVITNPQAVSFRERLERAMEPFGWDPQSPLNRIEFQSISGEVSVW